LVAAVSWPFKVPTIRSRMVISYPSVGAGPAPRKCSSVFERSGYRFA
jgi:hypothetical protein